MMRITTGTKVLPLVAALLGALSASPLQAQPKPKAAPKPLGSVAIENAEHLTGKKLSSAQKTLIMKAARQREDAINKARQAEWKKFRTTVAKTLGMSLAQMETKEKTAKGKK